METNFVLEETQFFCNIDWRFGTDMKLPCINCTVYSPHLSCALLLLLEHFILLHSNLVFFLASVVLLLPLLLPSTFFVQSAKALFQCYSNQQSQCDHRQELVIDFCKIFGLFFVDVVVFFNLFKREVFFIVNLRSFFYFQYFSAFLFH